MPGNKRFRVFIIGRQPCQAGPYTFGIYFQCIDLNNFPKNQPQSNPAAGLLSKHFTLRRLGCRHAGLFHLPLTGLQNSILLLCGQASRQFNGIQCQQLLHDTITHCLSYPFPILSLQVVFYFLSQAGQLSVLHPKKTHEILIQLRQFCDLNLVHLDRKQRLFASHFLALIVFGKIYFDGFFLACFKPYKTILKIRQDLTRTDFYRIILRTATFK